MIKVPCGGCVGCRLARAKDWATRITHEAKLYEDSCFATLTYADEHLPLDGSISKRPVQLFLKRLRKVVGPVRYFACGEYGDVTGRPHYHIILFGQAFLHDRYLWRKGAKGHVLYRSPSLETLWPFGSCEFGSVTPQSAGYVARYSLKKVTGKAAVEYYRRPHPVTGQIFDVLPEFAMMSTHPGLGAEWFDRYRSDYFPSDFAIIDGQKVRIPTYYNKLRAKTAPAIDLVKTQAKRKAAARTPQRKWNNSPERLAARNELTELRATRLKRTVE